MEALKPLHRDDGVLFVDSFESNVREENSIKEPWIGFLHNTPTHPPLIPLVYGPENDLDLGTITESRIWSESVATCRGIFVLSRHINDFLVRRIDVPIEVIYHATEFAERSFSLDRFLAKEEKKLVLVGHWLRNFQALFDLRVQTFRKCLLKCEPAVDYSRLLAHLDTDDSVTMLDNKTDVEYDCLLAENIVFLPLFDSGANNALIECIVRNTPVLVNPLPAVQEYLGEDYPLYFSDLDEAARKVQNMECIESATRYMERLDKKKLERSSFLRSFISSRIYRRLRVPPSTA